MRRIVAICNSSAGTADDDTLARALASLREGADVAVAAIDGPGGVDAALERHPARGPPGPWLAGRGASRGPWGPIRIATRSRSAVTARCPASSRPSPAATS